MVDVKPVLLSQPSRELVDDLPLWHAKKLVPFEARAGELTEEQVNAIQDIIADPQAHGFPRWFLNRQRDFKSGKDYQMASTTLDSTIRADVERIKKIKLNRGLRHY